MIYPLDARTQLLTLTSVTAVTQVAYVQNKRINLRVANLS